MFDFYCVMTKEKILGRAGGGNLYFGVALPVEGLKRAAATKNLPIISPDFAGFLFNINPVC